jgi:hypothetical protein
VATSIVFCRVANGQLSDSGPQQDLKKCDVNQLVKNRYRILIAMFKPYVPQASDCCHAKEMSSKSEVVIMPVLMKDEKKYSECADVLDQLEKWIYDIHSAARLCSSELPSSDVPEPIIGCHSRPDQPASHVPPTASEKDPLTGVKIPCFGDQLTRVRFASAKDLRAGFHSAKDIDWIISTHSVLQTGIPREMF